jgi:hypothetical protein
LRGAEAAAVEVSRRPGFGAVTHCRRSLSGFVCNPLKPESADAQGAIVRRMHFGGMFLRLRAKTALGMNSR